MQPTVASVAEASDDTIVTVLTKCEGTLVEIITKLEDVQDAVRVGSNVVLLAGCTIFGFMNFLGTESD